MATGQDPNRPQAPRPPRSAAAGPAAPSPPVGHRGDAPSGQVHPPAAAAVPHFAAFEEVTTTPLDASSLARHQAWTDAAAAQLALPKGSAAAYALGELRELLADAREQLSAEVAAHTARGSPSVPPVGRSLAAAGAEVPLAPAHASQLRGIERQLAALRGQVGQLPAPQADALARYLRRATAFTAALESLAEWLHRVVAG